MVFDQLHNMSTDYTVKVFDEFYNLDLVVNAEEYDVVRSYFAEYTGNNNSAKKFTEILFRIAQITEIPISDLLQSFQKGENPGVTRTLAYFLNSISTKTVLYGVDNIGTPNILAARNVIIDTA